MGLEGTRYDRNQPTLDRTWNAVEVVKETMRGRIVVKSLMYLDLTRDYSVKLLHDEYRRRLGEP
jgi:hypothetical protein